MKRVSDERLAELSAEAKRAMALDPKSLLFGRLGAYLLVSPMDLDALTTEIQSLRSNPAGVRVQPVEAEGVEVTDEMVERFGRAFWGSGWQRGGFETIRAALLAALSRKDGQEK